ncbi:HAD family hydrolase [Kitasatospora sp. NPDC088346]|uniref:HAD family hydrolase n=1 Tax=Kitasatospora sp. NPDC088346 TaxID=3364073 RepID=UPI0037F94EF7
MPLLLFDLDNTLLPRDAAYRAWAQDFLAEHRLPATDLHWLSTLDGSGYVPRSTVLGAAKRRYGLDHSLDFLLAHYRRGINSHIACPDSHVKALRAARSAGWTLGIVSNGGTRPQLEKIRRTGLGALVDGWVISEEADCVKPDPLIFEIAAQRCGVPPGPGWTSQTWMVGDHAPADIAGAEATGLRSVWLHHDRPWSEPGYRPTLSARGLPEAVGMVLTARNAPTAGSLGAGSRGAGSRGAGSVGAGSVGGSSPRRPRLRRPADQFATTALKDRSTAVTSASAASAVASAGTAAAAVPPGAGAAAAAGRRAGPGALFVRPVPAQPAASLGAFAYPAEGAGAGAGTGVAAG